MTTTRTDPIHGTLPDRTYEQLRDLIIRGRIAEGSRVIEAEVAAQFGISRTPVREALARLIHEGYLTPGSTGRRTEAVVAPLTAECVRELWGMIGALEGFVMKKVTALPDDRRERLVADLQQLNRELQECSEERPRNADRLFHLQTAFHVRFVNETAHARLRSVYDTIRPQVQRYEWVYGTRPDADYVPSTQEHLHIIDAIQAGDYIAARTAVESHWARAAKRTIAVITRVSEQRIRPTAGTRRALVNRQRS